MDTCGRHDRVDAGAFRAFITNARHQVAAQLDLQADDPGGAAQGELLGILAAHFGVKHEHPSALPEDTRLRLCNSLAEIPLPYDPFGLLHLDYLASLAAPAARICGRHRPTARTISGSYYTPQSIVRRIVDETLGVHLGEAADSDVVAGIRILDMACGSGVFLIEAGRRLTEFYTTHGLNHEEAHRRAARQLVGVDISADAAEVARLALAANGFDGAQIILADSLNANDGLGQFDIVIGNPPYNPISRLNCDTRRMLAAQYKSYAGHGDIHYCFFERGISLLRPGGRLGLLTSIYYIQASHAAALRAIIAEQAAIEKIIDCSRYDLFPDATIHCAITVLRKSLPIPERVFTYEPSEGKAFDFPQSELTAAPWVIVSAADREWRSRVERGSVPLGELCDIVQGPETGLNRAFTLSGERAKAAGIEAELLRPLIKNSDITAYGVRYRDRYMIYLPRGADISAWPRVSEHLAYYREALAAREICRSADEPWFELHRPRDRRQMNAPLKIVCPYRAEVNRFAIEQRRALNDGGDIRMIFPKPEIAVDQWYLVAILNSPLMQRYFAAIGRRKGVLFEYFKDVLRLLPIRILPPDDARHAALAKLSAQQHQQRIVERDSAVARIVSDIYEVDAKA